MLKCSESVANLPALLTGIIITPPTHAERGRGVGFGQPLDLVVGGDLVGPRPLSGVLLEFDRQKEPVIGTTPAHLVGQCGRNTLLP